MTYQVLARKWRPKGFASLVGQEHVVRALTHALDGGRLHHAYLFTGTRGVGKATLSRIFAKALNCETGVTSAPCGICRACKEIDEGRFVDYVEMDAASNRGVDEMAALLERAVYAPVDARFKVYMIDEVHMLTNHAFNAMLKTLEEPPPHVKFILATTDPQKIPVTVLSRCLQFNLKQMPSPAIADHLGRILAEEKTPAEGAALALLADCARGSMRDALSLLDQAIAYGGGKVTEQAVRSMLGAIDETYLYSILEGLARGDAAAVLAIAEDMRSRSVAFDGALQDLGALLHRVALAQAAPDAVKSEGSLGERLAALAMTLDPEDVQLYYQIAMQLAQVSELKSFDGETLELRVPPSAKHLAEKNFQDKLRGALQERFGKPVRLAVTISETTGNSARDRAASAISQDAFVRDLVENFDATIVESSIKPVQWRGSDDEGTTCGADEAGPADAGKHGQAPGAARLDRGRGPIGRGHGQGDNDLQARRQAGQHRSVPACRRQGDARRPRGGSDQRRRTQGRGRGAGEDGRADGRFGPASGDEAAVLSSFPT